MDRFFDCKIDVHSCVLIFFLISTGEFTERELTQKLCFILCFDVLYQNAVHFKIICYIFAIKILISKQAFTAALLSRHFFTDFILVSHYWILPF